MNKNVNLTEGKIFSTLIRLALPIMGTSFVHMAYNLTDIMWLGRVGTFAVAAAGAVGLLIWFGMGLVLISQVGVGIGVSQAYGRNDMEEVKKYMSNAIKLDIFIGIVYSLVLFLFRKNIIDFFKLKDQLVVNMAIDYLSIISIGIIFFFINPVFSAIFNGSGNSLTPFKVNTIGLIANMILDPIMIFGVGPIPALGIKGAAIATISAQFIVTCIFVIIAKKDVELFSNINLFTLPEKFYIKRLFKLGFPAFLQTGMHA